MKPGDILDGRYTIIDRLGAGGMGEVYMATHNFLGSSRVIKVVHPNISGNTDAKDRFLREARAATKVQHQNVATLHDFAALPDGAHYMVWELIAGENLAQRLRARGTLAPKLAVRIVLQALRGLDAIHRAGIIHRDISPENLMITADDEVKIIDLGVAKVDDTDAVSQTRTGIFVGKLRYAAPEQLGFIPEGEKIDARADLYAMAMVLVELLTGRPPYEATSPHEYFMRHATEPRKQTVTLPVEMAGSAALQAVLEKALARDRNNRYTTARDFAAALEEIERTLPEPRDMATLALPFDGDATMRVGESSKVDTLHRETVRTKGGADTPPTSPSQSPPSGNAPATLLTPLPLRTADPAPEAIIPPAAKMQPGLNPAYVVIFIVIVIGAAIAALVFWPGGFRRGAIVGLPETSTLPATATTTITAAERPPQAAETSVTVTSGTADSTQLTSTIATATTATAAPLAPPTNTAPPATSTIAQVIPPRTAPVTPKPRVTPPRETPPAETPAATDDDADAEPSAEAFGHAAVYRDGGDSDANDRALAILKRELRGTTTVALRAGGLTTALTRALREQFPNLQFEGEASVVIRYNGRTDRAGLGRRRRAGRGTVEKNGRVIFVYHLPDEIYRVGQDSVEAFANVLGEAFQD